MGFRGGWLRQGVLFRSCFEDPFKGDTTRGGLGEGAVVCVLFFVGREMWVEGFGDGCAAGGGRGLALRWRWDYWLKCGGSSWSGFDAGVL
jgi:hypothetical protein